EAVTEVGAPVFATVEECEADGLLPRDHVLDRCVLGCAMLRLARLALFEVRNRLLERIGPEEAPHVVDPHVGHRGSLLPAHSPRLVCVMTSIPIREYSTRYWSFWPPRPVHARW